ncbi:helix-turn-helix domain-containing protein [Saccharicrinis sp. FJH54]|uniref:helix-turn-helix domain-containing protein n=1 Tax=Saccharicrinis sp. FJH54 TaxID=3344665 RepID=UPI0035D4E4DF
MDFKLIEEKDLNKIIGKIDQLQSTIDSMGQKNVNPLTDKWLDNQEVCELLHMSRRKLQDMRDKSEIQFSKIGGKIYYKASDVENLLNQNYHG